MTTTQPMSGLYAGFGSLDELRGSLEALELPELERVARLIGVPSSDTSQASTRSALAARLVESSARRGALAALCDMAAYVRPMLGERLRGLWTEPRSLREPLAPGDALGEMVIERRLGESSRSSVLCVRHRGVQRRLKLLLPETPVRRADLERWLATSRAAAALGQPALPVEVVAGEFGTGQAVRVGVLSDWFEGAPLSQCWSATESFRLAHVWPVLRPILEALAALHARGLVHGGLAASNVLVADEAGTARVRLLDAGFHHLDVPLSVLLREARPALAPEQLAASSPTPRSDVYAFGVLLYRALGGRAPWAGQGMSGLIDKLTKDPEPLSFVAPRGAIVDELDELVLAMLDRDPARRPADAAAVLDIMESLVRLAERRDSGVPDSEFDDRLMKLLENPDDDVAAAVLESAVDRGIGHERVAEAFHVAAEQAIDAGKQATAKRLLLRAATLHEAVPGGGRAAEETYELLLQLDPSDEGAKAALIRLYRVRRRFDRLAELLLERAERSRGSERARAFADIGALFADELGEPDQAIVAYAHAVAAKPDAVEHIARVEALAGDREEAWQEVFAVCTDAVQEALPPDHRHALLCQLGRWYLERGHRPDLALKCYQAVLLVDPAHDPALAAAAEIYRRARQYRELCQVLLLRASGAVSPLLARELRVEAAGVLERHLADAAAARDLYEQVVEEDPGQDEAASRLLSAYERAGYVQAQARLLERRAAVLEGERRHAALCRLGDLELVDLGEPRSALRRYESVLAEDPTSLDALRGAERAHRVMEQYDRLIDNLEQQLRLSVTARQKLERLEQIATVYAEHFLDHERAVATFERMLELDRAHEPAMVELARHYRALGRFADMARIFERQLDLLDDPAKRAAKLVELGSVLDRQLGDAERALAAYEAARELDPKNSAALDALARLRSTAGDARAVDAIEALARSAADAPSRAAHWVRAARWLESRGQLEDAIVRYKRALGEADDPDAYLGLREAYLKRGDRRSAVELVERQIERVSSPFERAELWAVVAGLRRELDDLPAAEQAARQAVELDPTQPSARSLLGDLAFDAGRPAEAARHYESIVSSMEPPPDSARVHTRYVEALNRQGERERALQSAELLVNLAPERSEGHRLVAQLAFEVGNFSRAHDANERLLEQFGAGLGERDRALALYRLGESLRNLGQLAEAAQKLEGAAELDPESAEPLRALTELYRAEQRWTDLRRVLERRAERETGDAHHAVLVALGDLAASHFSDPGEAARQYLAALAERPKDRKLLVKLIELYSESRDWQHLLEVIQELCDTADDPVQKARYLHTAARVAAEELSDVPRALGLLAEALRHDPKLMPALHDALELQRRAGNLDEVEHLLEQAITLASEAGDREQALRLLEELGTLAASRDRIEPAVLAYEGAQRLDPANQRYQEQLAELYARDPKRYLDRAAEAQETLLRADPYRAEPYRALYELYTAARVPDAAWCASQALSALGRAQADEETFFKKHRRPGPVTASVNMTDREWNELMIHPGGDPLVTQVFALVEPCMLAVRGRSLRAFGMSPSGALRSEEHPYGLVRWLRAASALLGIELPLLIHDPKRAGALALLPSRPRAIALASAALNARLPDRRAAFVAASYLVYVRPGLGARYLVPTVLGLKAWLLATLRVVAPRLPIGAELEGPVEEAQKALAEHTSPGLRDRLAKPVGELLAQGARVDLGRWVRAVDITSDRAGLLMSDDLETALAAVGAAGDSANSVLAADRKKQLLRWSVSRQYVTLRERLGIALAR